MELTKQEAARLYALAWNSLDYTVLDDVLDDDITYTSQTILTDLVGKSEVVDYLQGKMNSIRSSTNAEVYAELGETRSYPAYTKPPEHCVVLAQGQQENVLAVVLFEVKDDRITQINLCSVAPAPSTAIRSGIYPK